MCLFFIFSFFFVCLFETLLFKIVVLILFFGNDYYFFFDFFFRIFVFLCCMCLKLTYFYCRVPNAKEGRDSTDHEIYGLDGVPQEGEWRGDVWFVNTQSSHMSPITPMLQVESQAKKHESTKQWAEVVEWLDCRRLSRRLWCTAACRTACTCLLAHRCLVCHLVFINLVSTRGCVTVFFFTFCCTCRCATARSTARLSTAATRVRATHTPLLSLSLCVDVVYL